MNTTERLFLMHYPNVTLVRESKIRQWAEDDIANGDIEGPIDLPTEDLIKQMNDSGLVTINSQSEDEIQEQRHGR